MRAAALVIATSLAFVALEIAQDYLRLAAGAGGADGLARMLVGYLQPWALFALLVPLVVVVARRFPRRVAVHVAAAAGFAVTHLGLLSLEHWIRYPDKIDLGRQLLKLLGYYLIPDVLLYAAVAAVVLAVDARRKAAELGARLAEARLSALRAQLHPHFLFNALNSVAMLVREERPKESLEVLSELGALLRRLFADAPGHEVPLADELDFSRRYLALEQVRFGDRLAVSFACEPGLEDALVPNLVLQPLVENAVRHGVARHAGAAKVSVRAFRDGARVAIEVWNDGPAPPPDAIAGTGLGATRGRLAGLYGDEQELALTAGPGGGALARVAVPLHRRPVAA